MNRRLLFGSLVLLAALSAAVVVEAERNYAAVTAVEETTASVESVDVVAGGLDVVVAVDNRMTDSLRVQFVHLSVERANSTAKASTPYNGHRTLPPGRSRVTAGIPPRQLSEPFVPGERVTVDGYLSVEVYNGYRFEVPIEPREVTL